MKTQLTSTDRLLGQDTRHMAVGMCAKHKIPLRHSLCKEVTFTEIFNMPIVQPYNGPIPDDIKAFNRIRSSKGTASVAHFYTADVFFESVWNSPERYLPMLMRLPAVISTDFSLYSDMLLPEIAWNTFRNKLLAAWWQKHGVNVIPNVSWGKENSLDICLDGYPRNSIIAINSTGLHNNLQAKRLWMRGYETVLDRLSPTHILRYGARQDGEMESISTFYRNDNYNSSCHGR